MSDPRTTLNRLQDLGTIAGRLTYEVDQLTKDVGAIGNTVATELMHPHTGVVVTVRHLERDVAGLDEQLAVLVRADVVERLQSIEAALAAATERRRWVIRDVLVYGVVLVVTSILSALLSVYFFKHP